MLHNMESVIIRQNVIPNIPRTTKIILQKLLDNTNCIFEMRSLTPVIELFGHRHVKINDKKGISLSLENYEIRPSAFMPRLKTKETNICKHVTKLQIKQYCKLCIDAIDLFSNVIELEIGNEKLFDFNYALARHQTLNLEPNFSLSKFPKLKHLSLLFSNAFLSDRHKTSPNKSKH